MATRKTTSKKATEAKVSVAPEVTAPTVGNSTDELVAQANINVEIVEDIADENKCAPDEPLDDFSANDENPKHKAAPKEDVILSSTVVLMNTSYNEILLNTGRPGATVRIAPKEIKSIDRELLRELMNNKIVRRWFDKGILTTNQDANETDTNEAVVPENLKGPVERTDSVSTISAKVTKFKQDGKVQIKL